MSTQCSLSSSARSATTRDEDCRPRAKGASFLGFSKFALKLFKLSNFTCNAGTEDHADKADAGKKPDAARRKWRFLKPRAADEGSATSQTGDSGELACHKNQIESGLRKKKLVIGEEANAVDKKIKETLSDMLLGERVDCTAISKNNAVGSDKITSCTLSQFLASDEHSPGQKRKYGDKEEEEERDCTDIVIKSRVRNPRTKYHTRRLIRELGRSAPADNTISIYLSKMLCAVGSAGDLFRPILFRIKLKKELPVVLAELRASFATAKMRKDLKCDVVFRAPEELWKKEILLGRRCKPLELGASARWSNAKEVPAICLARAGVGDD